MFYIRPDFVPGLVLSLSLLCLSPASSPAQDLSVASEDGVVTVTLDGQPLLEYRYEPHPTKMYVSRWYTPAGVQVLRDSPHDHVHHHALMYAIGIDGIDFWAEVPIEKCGRQVSKGCETAKTVDDNGCSQAVIKQRVQWVAPGDEILANESREIRAHVGVLPDASLLTWQFSLQPADGRDSIELWGRHYFGLGVRFVESMDKESEFVLARGAEVLKELGTQKVTRASWCAVRGNADGDPITVALFDSPDNKRHPATWFTMTTPFAYVSATLNLHEQPLTVARGQPLRLRRGVAVWDRHVDEAGIERAYRQWLKLQP